MTLFQTESYSRLDIDGKYEGQYTISIEYDLSGFQSGLSGIIQIPEWRNTIIAFSEWENTWGTFNITVANPGTSNVKRTLAGYATAILYRKGGNPSINPTQESDGKDVSVSGIVIQASAGSAESRLDIECSVSADEDKFTTAMTKWTVTWPDNAFSAPMTGQHVYDIAWGESIWQRAVNAGMGWKITLTPLLRK